MSWNYRAVRRIFDYDGHEEIGIYSVYYDEDGKIKGMSLEPAHVNSYSLEQLEEVLELMKECLQEPILDYSDALLTPDEFMRSPVERAELVNGVIVELPPRTLADAVTVASLGSVLFKFVEDHHLGKCAGGGSFLTDTRTVRTPAFSFLSNRDLEGENTDEIIKKAPTLAVEIISPEMIYGSMDDKADEFLAAGSRAVWIVNPRRRSVAVHTPDNTSVTYQIGDTISGGEVLPGLELPVAAIFEE